MAEESRALGPISYLIVEFPGSKMTGEGLDVLIDLTDRGIVRVLDLVFVQRELDGSIEAIELTDIDGDGALDLVVFQGAASGLIDESDLEDAKEAIEPGSSAAILIYENTWALPFANALRGAGAELVAAGYIPQDDLLASLDAIEG